MKLLTSLLQLPRPAKRAISVIVDILAVTIALLLAMLLSKDTVIPKNLVSWLSVYSYLIIGSIAVFVKLGLYRAVVRYVSVRAFIVVFTGAFISTLLLAALTYAFKINLPATGIVNYGLTALLIVGGSRFAMREIYHRLVSRKKNAGDDLRCWVGGASTCASANERRRVCPRGVRR